VFPGVNEYLQLRALQRYSSWEEKSKLVWQAADLAVYPWRQPENLQRPISERIWKEAT
jgi:hypothetical protein